MSKQIPWTFKSWIANFKDVDLPIGDLASDILEDTNFPEDDDFDTIHAYIYSKAHHSSVVETFVITWNYYLASK